MHSLSIKIGILLSLLVALPAAALPCTGDCDGGGSVEIDELVTGVNIALESSPLLACPGLDADGNGGADISEIMRAVGYALAGCPATAAALVGGVLSVERVYLATSSALIDAIAAINADTGSGSGDRCPIDGTSVRSCEDVRPGIARLVQTLTDCTYATPGGTLEVEGRIALTAPGRCPSTFIPVNVGAEFQIVQTARNGAAQTERVTSYDLNGTIANLTIGARPCMVKGGAGQLSGNVTTAGVGGGQVRLQLQPSQVTLLFGDFAERCAPGVATLGIDGTASIIDDASTPLDAFDVGFANLTGVMRRTTDGESIELTGGLQGACLGDGVQVTAPAALHLSPGAVCPSSGVLRLQRAGEVIEVSFEDGAVSIDTDIDRQPQLFTSCTVAQIRACGE